MSNTKILRRDSISSGRKFAIDSPRQRKNIQPENAQFAGEGFTSV